MFLKKEAFIYNGEEVVLSELSALQRLDYLGFVTEKTANFDREMKEGEQQALGEVMMRLTIEINAWLVSRALFNLNQTQDEHALYESVLREWSYDAMTLGAEKVLNLSGMNETAAQESSNDQSQDTSPEKP